MFCCLLKIVAKHPLFFFDYKSKKNQGFMNSDYKNWTIEKGDYTRKREERENVFSMLSKDTSIATMILIALIVFIILMTYLLF